MSAFSFECLSGPHEGERFAINTARVVLGRHPSCEVPILDTSVSRHHAAITREGERLLIEDLRSRNGTTVNGRRLAGRRLLAHGDEIVVGSQRMRFVDARAAVGGGDETTYQENDEEFVASSAGSSLIVSQMELPSPSADDVLAGHAEAQLRALFGINRAIGNSLSLKEVLPRLLDGLFDIYPQAERGFVLLCEPGSGRLLLKEKKFRTLQEQGPLRLSQSVLDAVTRSRRAILSNDLMADERFDASQSIMAGPMRSVMCVPISRADGEVIGVVQLDSRESGLGFRQRDLEVLAGVAGAAAQAVEQALAHDARVVQEKLKRDLEIAHRVQQGLLPSKPPEIDGYEVFDFYESAQHVGGDYFNYVPLSEGRMAVVLADVSGKGVSAALVMATLAADVRYCLASEPDLVAAVTKINESFCQNGWDERFATFVVVVIDPCRHRATLVNAGHLPVYVRDAQGGVQGVGPEQGGLPLGMDPGGSFRSSQIDIAPGTTLVLFTDGISEAMDIEDHIYGLDRLEALVAQPAGSAEEIGRRILTDVERHAAGQARSDDMCLLCVGRPAHGGGGAIRAGSPRRPGRPLA